MEEGEVEILRKPQTSTSLEEYFVIRIGKTAKSKGSVAWGEARS